MSKKVWIGNKENTKFKDTAWDKSTPDPIFGCSERTSDWGDAKTAGLTSSCPGISCGRNIYVQLASRGGIPLPHHKDTTLPLTLPPHIPIPTPYVVLDNLPQPAAHLRLYPHLQHPRGRRRRRHPQKQRQAGRSARARGLTTDG